MNYPNYTTCISLLKKEGIRENVLNHVKTVHCLSMIIGKRLIEQGHLINQPLLEAGSLLHDIGRSKTHDISHAIVGCEIARNLSLSNDIIAIIKNHIGAGITKTEAIEKGLPAEDFFPTAIEEKIVAAADNLTKGDRLQTILDHEQNMQQQGIMEGAKRCVALHRELSKMCGIDLDDLLAEQ